VARRPQSRKPGSAVVVMRRTKFFGRLRNRLAIDRRVVGDGLVLLPSA
jgi:hypothetical protein